MCKKTLRAAAAVIAAALLLQSCFLFPPEPEETPPPDVIPGHSLPQPQNPGASAGNSGDGRFALRYNPRASFNPFTGTDYDNMALTSLIYESLFVLNEDFLPRGVLCTDYSTDDGRTFRLTLAPDIAMSDGSNMDAHDAKFSIDQARESAKYSSRLRNITGVSVTGSLEITVTLNIVNYALPALLDIPVVKYGYSGTTPPGTGPYRFTSEDGDARLIPFPRYRYHDILPVETIYLVSCTDAQAGEYFTSGAVSMFAGNPNTSQTVHIRRDHEARYFNTTVLQYVGFSTRTEALADERVRLAVSLAVDREYIVGEVLDGRALAAPLAISPASALYDRAWESDIAGSTGDIRGEMSELLYSAGLYDLSEDSWLEYPASDGYTEVTLDFIVSSENPARVRAARRICDNLRATGINANLRQLSFIEFENALRGGDFDIYYAETRVPANFDFTSFVALGGALNFGGAGGQDYVDAVRAFLAAESESERRGAARDMCLMIERGAVFIPVAYIQYAVYTGRGAVQGMRLSQSGVFHNFAEWTIQI